MKRSFTLIEIIVTVIIVLVLATIAIGGYNKVIDGARQRTSEARILGLHAALEIYALENGVLGELTPEYIEKGYARVMSEADWWTRLACFITEFNSRTFAWAQEPGHISYIFNITFLEKYGARCYMFEPPDNQVGSVVYAVNGNIPMNTTWDMIADDRILIAEAKGSYVTDKSFDSTSDFAYRYKSENEGMAVTKDRTILKKKKDISQGKI